MINNIKMQLYKMVHTKSVWVVSIVAFILAILSNITFNLTGEPMKIFLDDVISSTISSTYILIYISIIGTITSMTFYKSGYVKSIAGYIQNPIKDILSYAITGSILVIELFLCVIVGTIIGVYIFYDIVECGDMSTLLLVILIQFMLHTAYLMFIIFLSRFTKSSAACITIGVMNALSLEIICYSLADFLIQRYLDGLNGFEIMRYSIAVNVRQLNVLICDNEIYRDGIISALVMFIIFFVISFIISKKSDIA